MATSSRRLNEPVSLPSMSSCRPASIASLIATLSSTESCLHSSLALLSLRYFFYSSCHLYSSFHPFLISVCILFADISFILNFVSVIFLLVDSSTSAKFDTIGPTGTGIDLIGGIKLLFCRQMNFTTLPKNLHFWTRIRQIF